MMLVMVTVFFGLQYFRAKKNPQTVSPNANAPPGSDGGGYLAAIARAVGWRGIERGEGGRAGDRDSGEAGGAGRRRGDDGG